MLKGMISHSVLHRGSKPATRRGVLSVISSLFDPLGIVEPYVLKGRMILQEVCRGNLGWDEEIPAELANVWNQRLTELLVLAKVKVDRCIMPKAFNHSVAVELHNFSDASEEGYAAVSYLRLVDVDGNVHCSFVMGKTRLSPLKKNHYPKARVYGSRLGGTVESGNSS